MSGEPESADGLVVRHEPPVLRLRLDRPERRNAVTDEMVYALVAAIEGAGDDEAIRVIELGATGDHFCSGFDLGGRGGDERPRAGATQRRLRAHAHRLIPSILETQTPVVCGARGWIAGLGLHLVLAADFAVVADDARLWEPFTASGFTPDSGGSWLLPRLVGVARAKRMLMLAEEVSGAEAAAWGMVHRAVPAGAVGDATADLVTRLAGAATVAVGLTKALVQGAHGVDLGRHLAHEALALELSTRTDDFKEAARARRDRRPPEFGGR